MSVPNQRNNRGLGNFSYTQNEAPSNFPDIMNNFPIPSSIILENNIPIGVTQYSEVIPLSKRNTRVISPEVNYYIQNPFMNNIQIINSYQINNNNINSAFPFKRHSRVPTQNLNKYANPYFNIKFFDEDNLRERPFYNRPKEKLPERKNFKSVKPTTYNANLKTFHVKIDIQKHIKLTNYEDLIKQKNDENIKKAREEMFLKQEKGRLKDDNDNINPKKEKEKENEKENEKEKENENEKLNNFLMDMNTYGNVTKMENKEEKLKNPEKYVEIKQVEEKEKEDPELSYLGLFGKVLEENNIDTIIEVEIGKEDAKKESEAITSLQFVTSGLIWRKKYDLYFELDQRRVHDLLSNKEECDKFKEDLATKLSKDYNVPKDKIIITFPQKGSFHVQVIFQSDEFNDLDVDEFKRKFINDKRYKELSKLKKVEKNLIMQGCKLSIRQLDPRGNRYYGWGEREKRGMEYYDPPKGWIGIGLKVLGKFKNDIWLGMQNIPGEWVVAYHGVGSQLGSKDVISVAGRIYTEGFKAGKRQNHKDCEDYFHKGQKVGEGVYCSPFIHIAEQYAGISEYKGRKYKTVIMVRVNPKARRHCFKCEESRVNQYWVTNGTTDEIRPYRILFKWIK